MEQNFTIPAFAEPITALADTPACSAAELKRRFQAPAEELRQAHNALAEAHEALDTKVEGIVTETFAGAIHESMLDEPLTDKLNAKADETSVAERFSAAQAARDALDATDKRLQTQISAKCEIVTGSYTGTGYDDQSPVRKITLGSQPKAVLVMSGGWANAFYKQQWGIMALPGVPGTGLTITSDGFEVSGWLNAADGKCNPFRYIAFK